MNFKPCKGGVWEATPGAPSFGRCSICKLPKDGHSASAVAYQNSHDTPKCTPDALRDYLRDLVKYLATHSHKSNTAEKLLVEARGWIESLQSETVATDRYIEGLEKVKEWANSIEGMIRRAPPSANDPGMTAVVMQMREWIARAAKLKPPEEKS